MIATHRTTKLFSIGLTLLLTMTMTGCKGCTEPDRELLGVEIHGAEDIEVGEFLNLWAELSYEEDLLPADIEFGYEPVFQWTVAPARVGTPSGGATLTESKSEDVTFSGKKPGSYTVRVTVTAGPQMKVTDTAHIAVFAPDEPATTETEETETTEGAGTTETTAQAQTTTTQPANPFQGNYSGTFEADVRAGEVKSGLAWGFMVDPRGNLTATSGVTWGDTDAWLGVRTVFQLQGRISADGFVDASGTYTFSGTLKSDLRTVNSSGAVTLAGRISGDTFTGRLISGGDVYFGAATATR